MSTSSIFWGVFFIFFGFFFLLKKLGICNEDYSYYLDFWPLIIILWGISILNLPEILKKIVTCLIAFLCAVLLFAFIHHSWFPFCDNDDYSENRKIEKKFNDVVNIPYSESYKFASLELNAGACSVKLEDTTNELIEVKSGFPAVNLDYTIIDTEEYVNLQLDLNYKGKILKRKKHNVVKVKLNPNPVWDLDFDIGAIDMDCDLSKYKIKDLCIDVGAADVDVILGNLYETTYLEINAGASDVTIKIPKGSGCKIESETGLSSEDFQGFLKSNNSYYTNGFDKASSKIIIKISGGVSDFEVERY